MHLFNSSTLRSSLLPVLIAGAILTPPAIGNTRELQAMNGNSTAMGSIDSAALVKAVKISGQPQRISIPAAGIDLPIVDGTYDPSIQDWSVSQTAANYATITPAVNNIEGKTLIYGHATQAIFGKIKSLKQGDTVAVQASNGRTFTYAITEERNVIPTDVSVFNQLDGSPGLVLITCDGVWSEQRKIIFLELTAVS